MDETEFMKLVRERFDHGQEMSYQEEGTFLSLLNGPFAYGNENKMIQYAKEHPEATMDEMLDYWDSISPNGLPPGMTEKDLLDDEDD